MAKIAQNNGAAVKRNARVLQCVRRSNRVVLETRSGKIEARAALNCAGLQADRVAQLCGEQPTARIVPFRGEYYELIPKRRGLVKTLIYPVPDPRFPFLGVHLTRGIDGAVEAGPNAVLALKRGGGSKFSFSAADAASALTYIGLLENGVPILARGSRGAAPILLKNRISHSAPPTDAGAQQRRHTPRRVRRPRSSPEPETAASLTTSYS